MTPFFRKIRYRLAKDNQFLKYSRYAIGEIVLVVIGILIALQINNWNTLKQQSKESDQFSMRLLNEVISNIHLVDDQILSMQMKASSSLEILSLIDQNKPDHSSSTLDSLIYNTILHHDLQLNLGTFEEGLNTGIIALIHSDSLRNLLYSFPAIIQDVRNNDRYTNDDLDNNLLPFLFKNYNYRKMDGRFSPYKKKIGTTKFRDFDNLNLLNSMEFESLIDNRVYVFSDNELLYQNLRLELIRLKTLIEKSLE